MLATQDSMPSSSLSPICIQANDTANNSKAPDSVFSSVSAQNHFQVLPKSTYNSGVSCVHPQVDTNSKTTSFGASTAQEVASVSVNVNPSLSIEQPFQAVASCDDRSRPAAKNDRINNQQFQRKSRRKRRKVKSDDVFGLSCKEYNMKFAKDTSFVEKSKAKKANSAQEREDCSAPEKKLELEAEERTARK